MQATSFLVAMIDTGRSRLTELFQQLPSGPRQLIGGTMVRILPSSARTKTRLRKLQRLFEHINEPADARYLGWMTTFDEAGRMALYSDNQLDLLAATVADLPDTAQADPAAWLSAAFGADRRRDPCNAGNGRRHSDLSAWRLTGEGRHHEHGA